ncbi:ABC transporter ATP-binding protein [Bacteroides heparinolyticus]|uniref:ABC transporter ATP-binding protein n=1 Tax=Prevotella heparinolytica TaxID=28113 RepID=UPI0035A00C34
MEKNIISNRIDLRVSRRRNLFFQATRQNKALTVFFFFVTVAIAFVAPLKSFIIQWLIDAPTKESAVHYLFFGAIITVLSFVLELVSRNVFTKIKYVCIRLVRSDIMKTTLFRDMNSYFRKDSSDILSALTNDIKILESDLYDAFYNILLYGGMLFFAIGMLIYINPTLLLFVLLASILPFVVPRLLDKKIHMARQNYSEQMASYTARTADILKGFETVHQFHVENRFDKNHSLAAQKISFAEMQFQNKMNLSISLSSFLSNLLFYIVLLSGMVLFFDDQMSIGYMVAATNLSNYIIAPCKMISQQYSKLKSTKSIQEKFLRLTEEPVCSKGKDIGKINEILWENVDFRYDGMISPLLSNISMLWEKSDRIALLGKSGSGKSTLIKLFCKYFDGYTGSIRINGIELKEISYDSFFQQVAIVSQNPYLFTDSIKNNICLYETFSDAEIESALVKAGLEEYIHNLPDGLNTIVSSGKNLSGGQAQRIALARALIRNKNILVIDEGTAGLDIDTAEQIMASILDIPNLTIIMITHDVRSKYLSSFNKRFLVFGGRIDIC